MNKKKPSRVSTDYDPVLRDAYFKATAEAEHLEWEKYRSDKIDVLSELFEKDLLQKDLTDQERNDLVARFRHYIQIEDQTREQDLAKKAQQKKLGVTALLVVFLVSGLLYVNAYRPFTSKQEVQEQLAFYIEKVNRGYGTYSQTYYDKLDTYSLKFSEPELDLFQEKMYQELDEKFLDLIAQLEAGEIRFYDDAREWASYFPNQEERETREQLADNAFGKGMGKAIDQGVDKLIKGTGSFMQRLFEFFK